MDPSYFLFPADNCEMFLSQLWSWSRGKFKICFYLNFSSRTILRHLKLLLVETKQNQIRTQKNSLFKFESFLQASTLHNALAFKVKCFLVFRFGFRIVAWSTRDKRYPRMRRTSRLPSVRVTLPSAWRGMGSVVWAVDVRDVNYLLVLLLSRMKTMILMEMSRWDIK